MPRACWDCDIAAAERRFSLSGSNPRQRPAPQGGEDSLRLFIAIALPDEVRAALADAMGVLRRAGADDGLRWVRPEGIHVTLKFLGPTPRAKVPAIVAGLREAVAGIAAFELHPAGFGAFHGGKNPHFTREHPREAYHYNLRVLWVGVEGETARLAELAARVEDAIAPLGFQREKRPFAAHLTLARMREDATRETRERVHQALVPYLSKSTMSVGGFDASRVPRFPPFRAGHVSLMQSTLQRGGALYSAVETFPLIGGHA
jgi:2'-5' RNA ligase